MLSATPRLPPDQKDLAYDLFKPDKEIENSLIPLTPEGLKKLDIKMQDKCYELEYKILGRLADDEENHYKSLSKEKEKNRYSDIKPCK